MTISASTSSQAFPEIPGYRLTEQLYLGSRTAVYRAVQTATQCSVVVKVLRQEYPSFGELVQFRNQYAIAKDLPIPGIVQPLSLESFGSGYTLVMEDWGGVSLGQYLQQQTLDLGEVLAIALQLAEILHNLHQHRIIHKDLKPANILIRPESLQVKLIDFSIASLLPKETQEIQNPNVLEGTLAYLAPEQTGRMNRGIDYRADFYALGITLYQLLSGKLPFESDDPMELIHCHIAKLPVPVNHVNLDVPAVVAAMVSKLMAKNAEDRYQSAMGLKHDLEQCLTQWKEPGALTQCLQNRIAPFQLGERDLSDRFLIPEKLYGREAEVQILLEAFDRVASPPENRVAGDPKSKILSGMPDRAINSKSELMLVAGFSGIGKTAVVNEVHKPITRQNGYFIKGKFDQFNRNIPLSAFVQALRDLMGQLLSESDQQLQHWQTQILEAVGENGQVLIGVIPELEQIIGKQPPAPELSGSAAQNRFNLLFQKFIAVFTTAEHPLVIFLDDLQWADSASLQLVKLLMNDNSYLLMLGAYRDNEVSPAHPFMLTVEELKKAGAIVHTIILTPLSFEDTNRLVAETLKCSPELAQPLTELVDCKTQGNPFFTTQFLKALHEDGYMTFNGNCRYWECDIAQVNALALTDDVVEFMAVQLQKLPEETQQVLKLAACVGSQFDLNTLAIVSEKSPTETATTLWKALQEGLIVPTTQVYKFFGNGLETAETDSSLANSTNPSALSALPSVAYRFLHDRVQQAAYSLIPASQKALTHWQIGQLLLQGLSQQQRGEKIFDLVNQLNLGKAILSSLSEHLQLAELNLQAGEKAKLSSAYQAAQIYCETGIALLPSEGWQTNYVLSYNLHRHGSEAAYLSGNFDQAEALYRAALDHAQTPLDKAVIYRIQMTQYQLQGRNAEAITIQRQSLELLGWAMPVESESTQASLDQQITTVNRFLEQQTIESILELPKMADDNIAEMLRILQILFYAAWLDGQPTLALLALAKMTTLSLQCGNSDMSPFGYVGYGLIANALLKNAAQAYQFGSMAVQLCEQFDNSDVRGMTNFLFAADVHSWSRPLREADTYYDNAFKYGMDAGNWLTVGFMMMQSGSDRLTYGKNLNDLYEIAQAHATFLRQVKSLENLDALTVGVLQPIRHLLGFTKTPFTFDDESFSEAEYLQNYCNAPYHLAWFYSVKIRHAYLFDQLSSYSDLIPKLSIIEETIPSHAKVPSSVFYIVLMHLALIPTASDEVQRQSHWQAILPLEERLIRWATDCPENVRHKYLLIQAEKAQLNGQKSEAINFYDQAIAQAQAQGYGYEAALANELAAKFHLAWGKEKVAAGYMQEAYYGYAHWGSKAKTDDLENRYPHLLQPILQRANQPLTGFETLASITPVHSIYATSGKSSFSSSVNDTLDFAALLKISQTFASTIALDELLQTLTQKMLENSGADHCVLMFCQDNQWQVRVIANLEQVTLQSTPLDNNPAVPVKLIQYVKNTLTAVALDDLDTDLPVIGNYLHQHQPKSVLCLPILNQGTLVGILYLENRLTSGVFTGDRLLILNFLCTQAAISLENARLYQQSQLYTQQLEKSLQELQENQTQLIQSTAFLEAQRESSRDGILVIDKNRKVSAYNQEFVKVWNIPAHIIETQDDYQLLGFVLDQLEQPKEFLEQVEYLYQHPDETSFDEVNLKNGNVLERASTTVKLPSGEHCGRIWYFRDISDRKSADRLIRQKNQELEQALIRLQQSQAQIVQSEKMSALGNLVAGVAHEINNPIGFLNGSINNAKDYVQDLLDYVVLYQQHHPNAAAPVQDKAEEIDLEFLSDDLPKLLNSMQGATDRIKSISTSLRTFSRADTEHKVSANLHDGMDSTLLILKYRLKANEFRPAIQVIQDYGELPAINCFPGQLNQVFMNILANAIDMFDEVAQSQSFTELKANPQQITIRSVMVENQVQISIRDNGKGMTEDVKARIFDHLFTTKGVGKGTGLGLAIAHQIVVEKHGGSLEVKSDLGQGTEFCLRLPIVL
ncbi:MAG: AAA family ATPase [Synechococcales bacterium]|nr:AAA family ATPase [Synechococcales bacterium]